MSIAHLLDRTCFDSCIPRVVEPIESGKITSVTLFNATITGGSAMVTVAENGKTAYPNVEIFGKTDDGVAFSAQGTGVGQVGGQLARVVSPLQRP